MNAKTLLEEFLKDQKARGTRDSGLNNIKGCLPRFFEWLDETGCRIEEVRAAQASAYQGWLLELPSRFGTTMKKISVQSYIRIASRLYEHLVREGKVPNNPFKLIKKVKKEKSFPKDLLKEDQMGKFLDSLEDFDQAKNLRVKKNNYRVHVICELIYASGLRIEEVMKLEVEDLDLRKGLVLVRDGKGGVPRTAYLNEYAKEILRLYLEVRETLFNENNQKNIKRLFGLNSDWIIIQMNRELETLCLQLGYPKLTNHRIRHVLGYHLLRAGCSIRHIQEILGHKSIKSTQVYTKVDKESLKAVVDDYHPRSRKDGKQHTEMVELS